MIPLLKLIDDCRYEMIKLANKYGFTADQTIQCSQQLDQLLNLLMTEENEKPARIVN